MSSAAFERWRRIPGYRWYEVSDRGRVVSRRGRVRILAQQMRGKPPRLYPAVTLYRGGRAETRFVHQLVLLAFRGPRPDGMECCHENDVATDNRLSNLRYDTPTANAADRARNKRALAIIETW
jgi:HNH endonuclease/NUMOD4 motif